MKFPDTKKCCIDCVYWLIKLPHEPCSSCDIYERDNYHSIYKIFEPNREIIVNVVDEWGIYKISSNGKECNKKKVIEKLSDVDDIDLYITLGEFMKGKNILMDVKQYILGKYNCNKMFVKRIE